MQTAASGGSLIDRMLGAVQLKSETYEEVERDENATTQALIVVVLAAIASGIGGLDQGSRGLIGGIVMGIFGWLITAVARLLRRHDDPGDAADLGDIWPGACGRWGLPIRRPFSTSSASSRPISGIVALVAAILFLIAMVVAIRAVFDFDTGRAIGTAVIAWIVGFIIVFLIVGAIIGLVFVASNAAT